jgi:hypothetical protein
MTRRQNSIRTAVMLVVVLVLLGVGSVSAGDTANAPTSSFTLQGDGCTGDPIITSFTANPTTSQAGQTSTLSWGMVYNAERVLLMTPEQKTGVATPGEMIATPDQTTTYTLRADCGRRRVSQQVTVNVITGTCSGTPSISSFTATPMIIAPGQTSTLSWGLASNAQAAVLVTTEGKLGVGTPGQQVVQPGQTTTYMLEAFCGNEVAKRYTTVAVEGANDCSGTPSVSYCRANPPVIQRGQSSNLEYGLVSNASGAYLGTPSVGVVGVSTPGQTTVQPETTSTYTLYALCGGTSVQKKATVNVE